MSRGRGLNFDKLVSTVFHWHDIGQVLWISLFVVEFWLINVSWSGCHRRWQLHGRVCLRVIERLCLTSPHQLKSLARIVDERSAGCLFRLLTPFCDDPILQRPGREHSEVIDGRLLYD